MKNHSNDSHSNGNFYGDPVSRGKYSASAKISPPTMGWGSCKKCNCSGYVSDMQHDGHCVCGHTAADHN